MFLFWQDPTPGDVERIGLTCRTRTYTHTHTPTCTTLAQLE